MNLDQVLASTISKEEMISSAKDYISKNLSIIPVGKNKVPLIPWKEFCDRIATPEEVDAWFLRYPDAQIGMITGKISGITVVDVEATGGEAEWSKLPQVGPIVKTGGEGRHYWFLYDSTMRNAVRIDGEIKSTDIRNDHGYVILPPSISEKGKYEWVQKTPPIAFPRNLFKTKEESISSGYVSDKFKDNIGMAYLASIYEGAGAGSRNDSMVKYIGYILTQIHPEDWEEKAWALAVQANNKNNPPLDERELRNSYDSIKRTEKTRAPKRFSPDEPEEWKTKKEEDDVRLLSEVAKAQTFDFSKPFPCGLDIFDEQIRGGFFPGDLNIVAAASGHGKTSFAQCIAYNFIKRNKEKVLFFSYEVLSQFVWEKFAHMGLSEEDLLYMPFKHTSGNLGWVKEKIIEAKEKYGVKFIVIDHMGFLEPEGTGRKNENYSIYLTMVSRQLKRIAVDQEVIIFVPVHVRKRPSGEKKSVVNLDIDDIGYSSGIYQEADLVFLLKREEQIGEDSTDLFTDYTLISLAKNRRGAKNPRGFYTLVKDIFIRDPDYRRVNPDTGYVNRSKSRVVGDDVDSLNEQLEREHREQEAQARMFGDNG